jgi:F-type H+-transporting ATPase subunit epsilon
MILEIISPDKTIFTGEVSLVQLPGTDGLFEILHNHAPLIATLKKGRVKIHDEHGKVKFIPIEGGMVEVFQNTVLVLAE